MHSVSACFQPFLHDVPGPRGTWALPYFLRKFPSSLSSPRLSFSVLVLFAYIPVVAISAWTVVLLVTATTGHLVRHRRPRPQEAGGQKKKQHAGGETKEEEDIEARPAWDA